MSTDGTTPWHLLEVSDQLLEEELSQPWMLWPRASAFLMRMALEQSLAEFWVSVAPGVEECSMRAQLLCLREYSDRSLAGQVESAWAALSGACHYHSYDVEPTAGELRTWHRQVTDVCDALSEAPGGGVGQEAVDDDVPETDLLTLRRYRYSAEAGGWIDTQVTATGRRSPVHSEDVARGLERTHQEERLRVLARMGKAETDDEREPLRREWKIRRAIIRAAAGGDPMPR